ncbi:MULTISPECIES: AlpA family transcriptional regulator [unclassified Acidocella]|uniref:helix-turn-helix transcriptional regulator n=1 Tax=unclassified Acidocella TaxID=2648610 RepID=UPI00028E4522|nr:MULTISPECIES: AlpA family transcriptional regulator [unclassified Acidocella]EKN01081.1 prophage CP4-57 regulator [Acidocella sp. MX-AZ02]WBO60594.1 AlpA family transcriptional regulator [Acidocella sp. MX-AZ03]
MSEHQPPPPDALVLLDVHQVREKVCLGVSTIYRMVNDGTFPKPVPLAPRTVRWVSAEIDAWIAEKMAARQAAGGKAAA